LGSGKEESLKFSGVVGKPFRFGGFEVKEETDFGYGLQTDDFIPGKGVFPETFEVGSQNEAAKGSIPSFPDYSFSKGVGSGFTRRLGFPLGGHGLGSKLSKKSWRVFSKFFLKMGSFFNSFGRR
jgi:hypothetical protein